MDFTTSSGGAALGAALVAPSKVMAPGGTHRCQATRGHPGSSPKRKSQRAATTGPGCLVVGSLVHDDWWWVFTGFPMVCGGFSMGSHGFRLVDGGFSKEGGE